MSRPCRAGVARLRAARDERTAGRDILVVIVAINVKRKKPAKAPVKRGAAKLGLGKPAKVAPRKLRAKPQVKPTQRTKQADVSRGAWPPRKVTKLFREFARPLLTAFPAADLEMLNGAMQTASMCWNLPILERCDYPHLAGLLRTMKQMPRPVKSALEAMIHDRRTKYPSLPFLIIATVGGTDLDSAMISAKARWLPDARPPGS